MTIVYMFTYLIFNDVISSAEPTENRKENTTLWDGEYICICLPISSELVE